MKNKAILAIYLLFIALLICTWLIVCPRYTVTGKTNHLYKHKVRGGYKNELVRHPETTIFWGGSIIIFFCATASFIFFVNIKELNRIIHVSLKNNSIFDTGEWSLFIKSDPSLQYLSIEDKTKAFERWKIQKNKP